ncbi:hypothetical protein ACSV4D_08865 [Flavobacterium sp. ARAG 55.4]|uniref:hypothetical protein n=1 Tax=Flavobacterium sp. ARAG 55.4 TaxID=3451357 RepID=UPI003F46D32A
MKKGMKLFFGITLTIFFSAAGVAQGIEKVLYVKPVAVKYKKDDSYSFTVGYLADADRDVNLELTQGPAKYWLSKKIPVKKGPGILEIKLDVTNPISVGDGYRLMLALRERDGDWKTTKASIVVNNIEFTDEDFRFADNASFSALTPNVLQSADLLGFEVDCQFSKEQQIQVSVWNGTTWISASDRIKVAPGNSTQELKVPIKTDLEGNNYRFMLNFGTEKDFEDKKVKSKEITGITFRK